RRALRDARSGLADRSLAVDYCGRNGRLRRTSHRALVPGGRLVCSIEHPIYTAPRRPGFGVDAQGNRSWPLDGYQREGERVTDWLAAGLVKPRRTLWTLVNLLTRRGLTLTPLHERAPTPAACGASPATAHGLPLPHVAIVSPRPDAGR
ncbi:SAM-dependent methyltransferase, partial [Burkholderia cenocepacia]